MLRDSAPAVVLTDASAPAPLHVSGIPFVDLRADQALLATGPTTTIRTEDVGLTARNLAYVIYTSGSSGRPKGVANEHLAVVNQLLWAQRTWKLASHESVLQRMSFSFDVSVREILWPLMTGARLVLASHNRHGDPDYLVPTMRRERITTAHFASSTLQLLLAHPELENCSELTRVIAGGERLAPEVARRLRERLPAATLYHMYGPTETTVGAIAWRCGPEDTLARIPIGRPIANTQAYVLDAEGEPVAVRVAGELYIGGAGVARGYLDRPALTTERFVADPFGATPGGRLYRTGDLARWRDDGALEFLGRADEQVKVRGFRIEPGEVEARLREHPAVREAAVVAREDATGDTRLMAYVAGPSRTDGPALRQHLQERLPAHMVPSVFVVVDALPLTSSGKVDRRALPEPDDRAAGHDHEAPVGATEQALALLWSELLGIANVGRRDHFFEIGGHSLLATRLAVRIKHDFAVDVAIRDIFDKPVLSALAEKLIDAQLAQFDPTELACLNRAMPDSE